MSGSIALTEQQIVSNSSLPNGKHELEAVVRHQATLVCPAIPQNCAVMGFSANVASAVELSQGVGKRPMPRRYGKYCVEDYDRATDRRHALHFGKRLARVRVREPATFIGITILLGVIAIAATAVPAIRASRVDPMSTLRAE